MSLSWSPPTVRSLWSTVPVALCLVFAARSSGDDAPGQTAASFHVEIQRSVLDRTFVGQGGVRYFISELSVTNRTDDELTIPLSETSLLADGKEYKAEIAPESLQGHGFHVVDESIRFRDLVQEDSLEIDPGETRSSWVVFTNLPMLSTVPQMTLLVHTPEEKQSVDVNQHHASRLRMTCQRIGPRQTLGVVRIAGTLDTVNVGTLASLTDEIAGQGVSRLVLSFEDSAAPLTDNLAGWVKQIAEDNGTARQYSHFPAIAPSIQEIHLAGLPGHSASTSSQQQGRPFVHETEAAAVEWALEPVFRYLPGAEVADQVLSGDRLVRAAALATGGRQLSANHLPLVIKLTESEDGVTRRAAFLALREFNNPQAIELLTRHARGKDATVATLAFECLASSRFEAAHRALARLLKKDLAVSSDDISRILAEYPRIEWSDVLTGYATGDALDESLSSEEAANVRQDALLALGRIGHPLLIDLLADALEADVSTVRDTAFSLLLSQQETRSDLVALEFALRRMEIEFPSSQILSLLQRVPDARAVPLLIKHFEAGGGNRNQLIKALARVGGAGIDETLASSYATLEKGEQATLLSELSQLQSQHTVRLAGDAIRSDEGVLFNAAISVLQRQESVDAVEVLRDALAETNSSRNVRVLTRALSEIGSHDAVYALRHVLNSVEDLDKRREVLGSLQRIQSRSPGVHALNLAKQHAAKEDWEKAIEDYDIAISIDPELTIAYSGRGHSHLQLEQLDEAGEDYRQALKHNPFDGLSLTGLSIVLVRQGKTDDGIALIQDKHGLFKDDVLFAYNSACVYGRAVEMAEQAVPSPGRDERIRELRGEAIKQLERSVQLGFRDLAFMKRDPDLAPLKDLPEFQNLRVEAPVDDK